MPLHKLAHYASITKSYWNVQNCCSGPSLALRKSLLSLASIRQSSLVNSSGGSPEPRPPTIRSAFALMSVDRKAQIPATRGNRLRNDGQRAILSSSAHSRMVASWSGNSVDLAPTYAVTTESPDVVRIDRLGGHRLEYRVWGIAGRSEAPATRLFLPT